MLELFYNKLLNEKELILQINVKPNSNKNEIKNILSNQVLKINIKAKPENGKANEELIKFLAGIFKVDKSKIRIIKGKTSKNKLIKIKINS